MYYFILFYYRLCVGLYVCLCVYVYKPLPPGVYPIADDKYISIYQYTHNRHSSMGFEPTISAGKRPQTHALDRPAAETGSSRV
jgi:hypothetical protein